MTPPPEISIIVVSYNTREMTLAALRSVELETRTPHEVIVIDNASEDGSAAAIAEAFPDIRLVAETRNLGFAIANNRAAELARGRYLLLLNPDTVVLEGAIDRLYAFAKARPEAMIWGGRTLYGDRTLNPTSCWGAMTLWSLVCRTTGLTGLFPRTTLFNPEGYGGWDRDTEREVGFVTGCFLMIERAFWNRLGGFDETYVMYGEEADLCFRARTLGARPRITPEAEIVHYVGASQSVPARRQVMVLKAKATLVREQFSGWRRAAGLALLRAWPWTRLVATAVLTRLAGGEKHHAAHARWREVWARREEWRDGYPRTRSGQ